MFLLHIIMHIIDLLTRAHIRLATKLLCLCSTSEMALLSSGFFVYRHFFARNWLQIYSFDIVPRTTGIENTSNTNSYYTLSRGNNSLKYFAITNIQKNICWVLVPKKAIIRRSNSKNYRIYRNDHWWNIQILYQKYINIHYRWLSDI